MKLTTFNEIVQMKTTPRLLVWLCQNSISIHGWKLINYNEGKNGFLSCHSVMSFSEHQHADISRIFSCTTLKAGVPVDLCGGVRRKNKGDLNDCEPNPGIKQS